MKRFIYSNFKWLMILFICCFSSVSAMAYDTWSVVGSKAIMNGSTDWAVAETGNDMTTSDGFNYTLTVSDKTLEAGTTYNYKFVKSHSYDEGEYPTGTNNLTLTVTETAVYTIVYSYNTSTNAYSAEATKTGDASGATHTYSIAGNSIDLFDDANFSATNTSTEMSLGSDGNYTWTRQNVILLTGWINYKVVVDHAWGESYPTDNAYFEITEDGSYDVTITFNPTTKAVNQTVTKTGEMADIYYIKHPWDGSNWTYKQLTANSDGTYSVVATYGNDGCNWRKAGSNTETWVGSPTLYGDPATGDYCVFTLDPTASTPTITITKQIVTTLEFEADLVDIPFYEKGGNLAVTLSPTVENPTIEFTSSDPEVIEVAAAVVDGKIVCEYTPKNIGSATITATFTDPTNVYATATATCDVDVYSDLAISATGYSKYLPSEVYNAYKNAVVINSGVTGTPLKITRMKKDGTDKVTVGTLTFVEDGDEVKYSFVTTKEAPEHLYDTEATGPSGSYADGVTIYDYLDASCANGGDQAEAYVYTVSDGQMTAEAEVPVYAGKMSVYAMADVKNDVMSYTKAQILADTNHSLAYQAGFKLNYAVTKGDATQVTDQIYYRNAYDVTTADSEVDSVFVTPTGTNIKVKEHESTNFTTAMKVGDNTYGTNQVVVYLPIVSIEATKKYSTHSATDATKDHYFTTKYTPYKTGYYFWSVQTASATNASEFTNEGGGVRVWRSKVVTGLEEFSNFTTRLTNFKYFDNMGTDGLSDKTWPVTGIGNETIDLTTEFGETKSVSSTMFGASSETLEPTETVLCRYYYRTNSGAVNGVALPSASTNAPAKAVQTNDDDEDSYAYYVAEQYKEITFTATSITTAVEDVTAAKNVASVKYYNVAGMESDEPFDGMNIVVTRYTDGSTSSSKVMK